MDKMVLKELVITHRPITVKTNRLEYQSRPWNTNHWGKEIPDVRRNDDETSIWKVQEHAVKANPAS
jgi:hypothetical protein